MEDAVRLIQDECTPRLNNMISIAQLLDDELTTAQNTAVEEEALKVQIIIYTSVAALVLMIIVLVALASRIIRSVVTPVGQVHTALVGFSEGNLNIPVEYESKNELGEMCDAMRRCQNILSGVIEDTCDLLGQMADGDFSVHSRNRELYVGNLSSIIQSLAGIKRIFSAFSGAKSYFCKFCIFCKNCLLRLHHASITIISEHGDRTVQTRF